jgi:hypothetical protein
MDFRIYLRRPEGLLSLYKIGRSKGGDIAIAATVPPPFSQGEHLTYHADGNCFQHSQGAMHKARRQPLSSFRGTETILCVPLITVFLTPPSATLRNTARPRDIVTDRGKDFGLEIILSEHVIELPVLEHRARREVFVKPGTPHMLLEIFDNPGLVIAGERYPPSGRYDWSTLHIPSSRRAYLEDMEATAVPLVSQRGMFGETSFEFSILQVGALTVSLRYLTRKGQGTFPLHGPPEGLIFHLKPAQNEAAHYRIGIQSSANGAQFGSLFFHRDRTGKWVGSWGFGGDGPPEVSLIYEFVVPPGATSMSEVNIRQLEGWSPTTT